MAEEKKEEIQLNLEEGLEAATAKVLNKFLDGDNIDEKLLRQYLALERQRHAANCQYDHVQESESAHDRALELENIKFQHETELKAKELEGERERQTAQWVRNVDIESERQKHELKLKELECESRRRESKSALVANGLIALAQVVATVGTCICALGLQKHNDSMMAEQTEKWMKFAAGEDALPGDFRNAKGSMNLKNPIDLLRRR